MRKLCERTALASFLVAGIAAHAVTPVHRNAAADDCAPSPIKTTDRDTYDAFYGLWDNADFREPFALGPLREGITTRFGTASERVFRSGRTRIAMQLDDTLDWNRRIFLQVARALATVPGALLHRMPRPLYLEVTNFEHGGQAGRASMTWRRSKGEPPTYRVSVYAVAFDVDAPGGLPRLREPFEEVLIHEMAHVLDYAARVERLQRNDCAGDACRLSDGKRWLAAVASSPCAVSDYAETSNREDFAESVLAWLAYYAGRQGGLSPQSRGALRERLGQRWGVLNRLMHDRL